MHICIDMKISITWNEIFLLQDTSSKHDLVLKILCKNENISHLKLNILSFVKVQLNSKQKKTKKYIFVHVF